MTEQTQQPQIAAVLVTAELFAGLQQYLFARPYNEVANLIQAMGQSPALQQPQLDHLNTFGQVADEKTDAAEEEEPTKKDDKPKK